MTAANRLKELQKAFKNEQAVKSKGFSPLEPGKYQFKITRAVIKDVNFSWYEGPSLNIELTVLTGPSKGRKAFRNHFLLSPGKGNFPSGMAIFKGELETLELDMPTSLTEKAINALLKEMVGLCVNGAIVANKKNPAYPNVYINNLIHASDEEDDDEEEIEEEHDDDDVEEEEEEEDEPAPKKAKKKLNLKKKANDSDEDDDEDWDDDEWDDD